MLPSDSSTTARMPVHATGMQVNGYHAASRSWMTVAPAWEFGPACRTWPAGSSPPSSGTGRLVAFHCYHKTASGQRGGMAAKRGVLRPLVREHLEVIGSHLAWHGSVNVDYLLADSGVPRDIDAIPRLVEPMNAAFSGVNLADLPVRLSLGVSLDLVEGRPGVTSHMLVQALLGVADRGGT
jgi:hypothetical protein